MRSSLKKSTPDCVVDGTSPQPTIQSQKANGWFATYCFAGDTCYGGGHTPDVKLGDLKRWRTGLISGTTVGGMDRTEQFFPGFISDIETGHLRDVINHECGRTAEIMAEPFGITWLFIDYQYRVFFVGERHQLWRTPHHPGTAGCGGGRRHRCPDTVYPEWL